MSPDHLKPKPSSETESRTPGASVQKQQITHREGKKTDREALLWQKHDVFLQTQNKLIFISQVTICLFSTAVMTLLTFEYKCFCTPFVKTLKVFEFYESINISILPFFNFLTMRHAVWGLGFGWSREPH